MVDDDDNDVDVDVDDDDDEGNIVLVNSQDSRLCYKNMCSQETFNHTILTILYFYHWKLISYSVSVSTLYFGCHIFSYITEVNIYMGFS